MGVDWRIWIFRGNLGLRFLVLKSVFLFFWIGILGICFDNFFKVFIGWIWEKYLDLESREVCLWMYFYMGFIVWWGFKGKVCLWVIRDLMLMRRWGEEVVLGFFRESLSFGFVFLWVLLGVISCIGCMGSFFRIF